MFFFSLLPDHMKRKTRRRPSWGRGIIRKKKNYKKGTEEEEDEGAELKLETEVPSDSCLTQDEESSCDTMDPQPNGHHTHPHTYGISTEEESSNEAPRGQITDTQGESNTGIGPKEDETPATDDKAKSTSTDKDPQSKSVSYCKNKEPQAQAIQSKDEGSSSKDEALQSKDEGSQAKSENPQAKPKEEGFQPMDVEKFQPKDDEVQSRTEQQSSAPTPATAPHVPRECVNGNESMDSLDSQALKCSETEGPTAVEGEASGEEEDVSASAVSRGTQEEDGRTGDTETGKEEQDREGTEGLSVVNFDLFLVHHHTHCCLGEES